MKKYYVNFTSIKVYQTITNEYFSGNINIYISLTMYELLIYVQ